MQHDSNDPTAELAERVAHALEVKWPQVYGTGWDTDEAVQILAAELRPLVEERDALQLLVEGTDRLLAAYRRGRAPSERTWNRLERAKKKLAAARAQHTETETEE